MLANGIVQMLVPHPKIPTIPLSTRYLIVGGLDRLTWKHHAIHGDDKEQCSHNEAIVPSKAPVDCGPLDYTQDDHDQAQYAKGGSKNGGNASLTLLGYLASGHGKIGSA